MKFLKNIDYNNIDSGIEYLKTNKFNYYFSYWFKYQLNSFVNNLNKFIVKCSNMI